jgi:D-glycero-alpha-D-manno-heptose-7-phosphate kinase
VDRLINALAPIRICDNGGWTDTWFAGYGSIFNIAVTPFAEVQMRVSAQDERTPRITIHAENFGSRYTIVPPTGTYTQHPLIEAAFEAMHVPEHLALDVTIFSEAPAGCSTGTSAAVSVALIGALAQLTGTPLSPRAVARTAHRIETELLGQQCGIQDQIASAVGGINLIEMHAYPEATVTAIELPDPTWWELERRLSLVFVGQSHVSSDTHRMVIRDLERAGPEAPPLVRLRATAPASVAALRVCNFDAFGRVMIENTEAQRALHGGLIGAGHQQIIDLARTHGAIGWKVNGAGGDGGSVTLLSGSRMDVARRMIAAIEAAGYQHIPIHISRRGLRVWESAPELVGKSPG